MRLIRVKLLVNVGVDKGVFKRRRCVVTTHVAHVLIVVTSVIEVAVRIYRAREVLSRNDLWRVAHADLLVVRLTQMIVI